MDTWVFMCFTSSLHSLLCYCMWAINMLELFQIILTLLLFFILSIINMGIIIKVKAFFGGRCGAPVLQKMYDILKLVKKSIKLSQTTSWVFFAAPFCALVVPLFAFFIFTLCGYSATYQFWGRFFTFCLYFWGITIFHDLIRTWYFFKFWGNGKC